MMKTATKTSGAPTPTLAGQGIGNAVIVLEPELMNICTEMFHEIPVRIIRTGKGAMFPIVDIAKGIDYSRGAIGDLVRRHKEDLDEYSSLLVIRTQAGSRDAICLNRDGIIALILLLDTKRIKDSAKRDRIREFRKWAIETLGKVMDGIPVQQTAKMSLTDAMNKYMDAAIRFSQATGIPKNEVIEVSLRIIEAKTGEDLDLFRQMIVPKKQEIIVVQPNQPKMLPHSGDPVRDFLNRCCLPQGEVTRRDLYRVYIQWCGIHETPMGTKAFAIALRQKGIKERSSNNARYWVGVELVAKFREALL